MNNCGFTFQVLTFYWTKKCLLMCKCLFLMQIKRKKHAEYFLHENQKEKNCWNRLLLVHIAPESDETIETIEFSSTGKGISIVFKASSTVRQTFIRCSNSMETFCVLYSALKITPFASVQNKRYEELKQRNICCALACRKVMKVTRC